MGIFKQKPEITFEFKEYEDVCENLPFYKTCNMSLANMFPNDLYDCCAIVEMNIYIKDKETGRLSDAEIANVGTVESMVQQFADVIYAGKGINCAEGMAYLLFYVPQKGSQKVADIFSVMFQSSFRRTETNIIHDPKGKKYFELLYPDKYHVRTIEIENIINQLNELGDDGSQSRDVKYHINFTSKDNVIAFASEAFKSGYEYLDMIKETVEGTVLPRFKLILKNNIPFEYELVNEKVRYLIDLAQKHSGDYKGVETDIIE